MDNNETVTLSPKVRICSREFVSDIPDDAPVYCLQCGWLGQLADLGADPACPKCKSDDVWWARPLEGMRSMNLVFHPDGTVTEAAYCRTSNKSTKLATQAINPPIPFAFPQNTFHNQDSESLVVRR